MRMQDRRADSRACSTEIQLAEETRGVAYAKMKQEMNLRSLLYTEKGLEWAVKIWDEFARNRRELRTLKEDMEEKLTGIWGMGKLERT